MVFDNQCDEKLIYVIREVIVFWLVCVYSLLDHCCGSTSILISDFVVSHLILGLQLLSLMQKLEEDCSSIVLKFVTIGDPHVGKTSLIRQACTYTFQHNNYPTICCEYSVKKLKINQIPVKIMFWDTHGSERYRFLSNAFYRGLDAAFFIYSATDQKSLESIDELWIKNKRDCNDNNPKSVGLEVLVQNKCDLLRQFPVEMVQDVSLRHSIERRQVSAKTGQGVDQLFREMARKVLINKGQLQDVKNKVKLPLQSKPQTKSKCF